MALGMAMTGCFGIAFAAAGHAIAGWFVHEEAVVSIAAQLLVIAALFQLFDGWQVTGAAALRGMTDVRVPAVITFIAYWAIALPLGYALGIRGPFGAAGMWVGIAAGLGFAAVFFAIRFARQTRA
jgi:MATE family multidrug resistance protein